MTPRKLFPSPAPAFEQRRRLLKMVGIGGLAASTGVWAQTYPTRPIRLISSLAAGGMSDIFIRVATQMAAKHLGQPIVVENRPGASGVLGANAMAQISRGDGYVLLQSLMTMIRLPHLQSVGFDPMKDLTFISGLGAASYGIVVRADSPHASIGDLIAAAKARPGEVSYGSIGVASAPYMVMEELGQMAGVKWLHIPYKGGSETNNALLGGVIDAVSDSTSWGPMVDAGKFRLLVTFGEKRLKQWPDAPTAKELGIPLVHQSLIGVGGPKGMDAGVINTLDSAFKKATREPEFEQVLDRFALVPAYLNHDDYTAYMRSAYEREGVLLKRMGLSVPK